MIEKYILKQLANLLTLFESSQKCLEPADLFVAS